MNKKEGKWQMGPALGGRFLFVGPANYRDNSGSYCLGWRMLEKGRFTQPQSIILSLQLNFAPTELD